MTPDHPGMIHAYADNVSRLLTKHALVILESFGDETARFEEKAPQMLLFEPLSTSRSFLVQGDVRMSITFVQDNMTWMAWCRCILGRWDFLLAH